MPFSLTCKFSKLLRMQRQTDRNLLVFAQLWDLEQAEGAQILRNTRSEQKRPEIDVRTYAAFDNLY